MIITRIIDFPDDKASAFCIEDINGDFNIYLSSRLSAEDRLSAYMHELAHIIGKDFDRFDVNEIEIRRAG